MATLDELAERKELIRIKLTLSWREFDNRRLFGAPEFIEWMQDGLQKVPITEMGGSLSPTEQLRDLFHQYVIGADFSDDRRFKCLRHTPEPFVWEQKTPELRMFGWVPEKDSFIVVCGDSAENVKVHDLYTGYLSNVVRFREQLELNEPKSIESRRVSDVVSV